VSQLWQFWHSLCRRFTVTGYSWTRGGGGGGGEREGGGGRRDGVGREGRSQEGGREGGREREAEGGREEEELSADFT
jgi:hypothetical protein